MDFILLLIEKCVQSDKLLFSLGKVKYKRKDIEEKQS